MQGTKGKILSSKPPMEPGREAYDGHHYSSLAVNESDRGQKGHLIGLAFDSKQTGQPTKASNEEPALSTNLAKRK